MFSSRLRCPFDRNRVSEAVEARRHSGSELLDLTLSNPTQASLQYPTGDIVAALGNSRAISYDPHPQGLREARAAIGARYEYDPDRIVLTASTSEAYSYLFKLLCDPGDEVLVPQPSYPLFDFLADLDSVRIRHYPLFYDAGWAIDMAALRQAANARSRAVVIVNPNNPTGSFLKRSEYAEMAQICESAGLAIISDEVFSEYAFAPDAERVQTLGGRSDVLTFSLNGLSKAAGLPQMKLGWIAVSGPNDLVEQAIVRLELIADTFLSVNTPVQWAVPRLLRVGDAIKQQIRARTQRNLAVLREILGGTMFRVLDVEAGWNAIVQAPRTMTEEQWILTLLEQHAVLLQPGYFYDFTAEAFLIASLLTPEDIFDEGIRRLAACGS
jgi:aspartate/methionine/tyrosine aminotransferase